MKKAQIPCSKVNLKMRVIAKRRPSVDYVLINGWINPIQGIDGSDTQCWPQVTRPGSSVGRPERKRGPSKDNAALEGGGFDSSLDGMNLSRLLEDLAGFFNVSLTMSAP